MAVGGASPVWGRGLISTGITFDVQVGGGFVGAAVAGERSHVALCRLLDHHGALLAVRLDEDVLGGEDFVSTLEPPDLGAGLAHLAGQNHLVLLDGGVVLEPRREVQVALCKKIRNDDDNNNDKQLTV